MELMRKQMNGYQVLQSKVQQFEQQSDMIIPDVNPDAGAVLGIWGNCTVTEQMLRRDRITAGGTVCFSLLYQPENGGGAVTLKGSLSFQEVLELKGAAEENMMFLQAEVTELRAMVLNSRKVGIQCRIALYAWVYQRQSMLLTEGVQAKPEEGIQLRLVRQQTQGLTAILQKGLSISEEVRLGEVAHGDQLLHAVLQWNAEDIRTLNQKIMVRGAVQVHTLFLDENAALRELDYSLPFSQIVESNDVRPDCSAELRYVTTQQQISLDRREEGLFLLCKLGANVIMEVYREQELTVVSDLYSTRYQTEAEYTPVPACGCKREMKHSKLQETVKTDETVCRVLHFCCCGATAEVSEGKLRSAFYVSVFWEDETGARKQKLVTLREEIPAEGACDGAVTVTASGLTVSGTGEGFCVELQAQYRLRLPEAQQAKQVERCQLDSGRSRSGYAPGTLLLRTVGPRECTWDLAKAYGTTERAILSANHLMPDQILDENQLVMIPFLQK